MSITSLLTTSRSYAGDITCLFANAVILTCIWDFPTSKTHIFSYFGKLINARENITRAVILFSCFAAIGSLYCYENINSRNMFRRDLCYGTMLVGMFSIYTLCNFYSSIPQFLKQ